MVVQGQNVPLPEASVGFSGAIQNRTRWDDSIKWFDIPDRVVVTVRFFGPVFIVHNHWLATRKGKKFPLVCPAYDQATQSFAKGKCPVEDDFNFPHIAEEAKKVNPLFNEETDPTLKELKGIKAHMAGFGHVIVRNPVNFQGNDKGLQKPWQPIKLQPSVLFSLIRLKSMNRINIQGKFYEADVADPYWGRDIHIMYNSSERNPQQRYMINLGDHTPLTDVEKTYLSDLYQWKEIVEYPTYEDVKQHLIVNGYYNMLNQLKGVQSFGDTKPTQFAHMEQCLTPVPKSPYDTDVPLPVPTYPQTPQMAPMTNNFPQMPSNTQMSMPPVPQMAMAGLTEANVPQASPLPTNVPPPSFNQPVKAVTQVDSLEIPFGDDTDDGSSVFNLPTEDIVVKKAPAKKAVVSQKTFVVKGKPSGVSADEFQKIIQDFGNNLARAKPFKTSEDPDLEDLDVLACYGNYCGDLNCVKCPLRQYCLHA